MKKTTIFAATILLLSLCNSARAEGGLFEIGAKAGVTTQSVNFSNTEKRHGGTYGLSTSGRFGYHLGIMSRINLPLVHFQPEILFTNTGYRINAVNNSVPGDNPAYKSIVRVRNVEVPVLVGMRLMWLRIQAGPNFTVMTEARTKDKSLVQDVHVTKPSVSYLLGVGLTFGHFDFDVRFNGNFSRTTQDILFQNLSTRQDYKSKNKFWWFSVGYMF